MEAIIYARLSQDRLGEGENVAEQRERGEALALARGWSVVETITDNDTSASGRKRRPGFERLLELLAAGRAQVVVARDMDRLLRSARDRLRMLELGKERGLTLAYWHGQDVDLSTPAGRLVADIMGAVALNEIEAKGDRQRLAAARAAAQGKRVGGRRPFGYEADGVTIRPAEADALAAVYDGLVAGRSLAGMARQLNQGGLPTAPGGGWTGRSLGVTLANPRYAGIRAVNRRVDGRRKGWEEVAPAVWPAVVPETTWRAAQAILGDPSRLTARRNLRGAKHLLTGVALCGVCGATVHAGAAAGNVVYRCSESDGHIARKAAPVEDWVSRVVMTKLAQPDAAELLTVETDASRPDAGALAREAAAQRVLVDQIASDYGAGILTRSAYLAAMQRATARLAAIQTEQAEAGRVDVLGPLLADPEAVWAAMADDEKRVAINTLMTVTLHPVGRGARTFRPETVEITWH